MKFNRLLILLIAITTDSFSDFSAKIDRSVIDVNETLKLELVLDKQIFSGQPDIKNLSENFEVLSNNRQQSFSSINGQTQSSTTWSLTLKPKKAGNLKIPSISFRNESTKEIQVKVNNISNSKVFNPSNQTIYTETQVDNKTVFVDQEIIFTVRLLTAVNLQDYSITALQIPDAEVFRLSDTSYQKVINGRNYIVLEIKYAIFPNKSGELTIPQLRFSAFEIDPRNQYSLFNNRGNQVIRETQSSTIDVLEIPLSSTSNYWLPSKDVSISQRWSENLNEASVGEPITRTIIIKSKGTTASQIPPIDLENSENLRIYPDQPQIDQQVSEEGLISERTEVYAIVPKTSGIVTIPEISLTWWNTEANQEEKAKIPGSSFNVKAEYNNTLDTNINENGTEIPTEIVDKLDSKSSSSPEALLSTTNFLMLTNFVLLSIIIFLLIKFSQDKQAKRLMSKQDKIESEADSVTNVLSSIKQAARKNNLMDMRELILRWGSITFPYLNPLTLQRLAISMDDQELATKFESLDNYLFGNTKTKELVLDLNIIADTLSIYTKSVTKKNEKKSKTNPLRNLYPN